jgi:hypothetical protein
MSVQYPHHPRPKRGFKYLSDEFVGAVRRNGHSLQGLADKIKQNRAGFRRWIEQTDRVNENSPKVFKLAEIVGFPIEKAFEV